MSEGPAPGAARLADRVSRIAMSATLRVSGLAKRMRADGLDVLDFSVGEPDRPTPARIKQAGIEAIEADRTRYTANEGLLELRRAIADKLDREQGLRYGADQLLVSTGAKASLYFASMALFEPGDEVLIPAPYWVSYPQQVGLAGATPRIVATTVDDGFKLRADALAAAVTPATRAVILNYPSNPTGVCYAREELAALAEVCVERDLFVISDEIYEKLVYGAEPFTTIAATHPGMPERTLVVNGMSKAYAMTGWRLGWAAGPRPVIAAMSKLQSHATSNAASISQWAGLTALRDAEHDVVDMRDAFAARRDVMLTELSTLDGVTCVRPDGAFYVFPDVSTLLGRGDGAPATSEELALFLLEQAQVAVVPGEAFGAPGHLRLSYAASTEQIREGMERIRRAIATR